MKLPLDYRFPTERCVLRALTKEDAPFVWSASRFPNFTKGMLWDPPETMKEIEEWTETTRGDWEQGKTYTFTIERKEDGAFLGRVALRNKADGIWSMGYWLHPDYWGKGYMTEACTGALCIAFTELHAQEVNSQHATWNEQSGKVMQRCGMKHVESLKEGFLKHGVWVPEHVYAITREEWESE